ncbi:bacterial Ig-like domain-containing protein, partial [Pediococcus pentosaceus]
MGRETKLHYKMYKDGKKWMFCGLATMGIVAGLGVVDTHIFADTNQPESVKYSEIKDKTDIKTVDDSTMVSLNTRLATPKKEDTDRTRTNISGNEVVGSTNSTVDKMNNSTTDSSKNVNTMETTDNKTETTAKVVENDNEHTNTTAEASSNTSSESKDTNMNKNSKTDSYPTEKPDTNANNLANKNTNKSQNNSSTADVQANSNTTVDDMANNMDRKPKNQTMPNQDTNVDDSININESTKNQDTVMGEDVPAENTDTTVEKKQIDNPKKENDSKKNNIKVIHDGSEDTPIWIEAHDSTISAGPNSKWSASDNFDWATNDGDPIDFKYITVSGTVNPQVAGDYQVTYSFKDEHGNVGTTTVTVHVVASQVNVDGHDSTIIAGPNSKWSASDNFDGGTDADGNPIDFKDVKVSGTVNPQVAGDYQVTYSYTDAYGNTASKTVTVHVVASQVSVDGHDSTIIAGPNSKWSASDNFDGGTDADGNPIDFKDVKVSGTVN